MPGGSATRVPLCPASLDSFLARRFFQALDFEIGAENSCPDGVCLARLRRRSQAIIEAGRVAEEAVLQWGIDNVGRANQLWIDNGGEILALSDEDRAAMNQTFKAVSDRILSEDPEVAAEYEKLLGVVEAQR